MRLFLSSAIVALVAATTLPALAGPSLELGLTGGGRFFEGEEDLVYGVDIDLRSPTLTIPAPEYGLRLDLLATDKIFLEVETMYARAVTMRRTSPVNETQFRFGVGYNITQAPVFGTYGTVTPNVMAFVGGRDLRTTEALPLQTDNFQQTRGAVTWGLGAKWNCGKFVLRADARHTLSSPSFAHEPRNDFDFTVGMGYVIGGAFTPCGRGEVEREPAPTWEPPQPPTPPLPPAPAPKKEIFFPGVRFALESAVLTEGQLATLDDVVDTLNANPHIRLRIEGYADATGPLAFNEDLSRARAEAVMQYLLSRGIDQSRLELEGYGISNPVADNETEEGRAANRRATFTVIE